MDKLEELKKEATDLGLQFSPNIGEAKLQDKVDAFYKAQEAGEPKVVAVEKVTKEKVDPEITRKRSRATAYDRAVQTKIVTLTDNDQRVNHKTTVATVNCSNMAFDLGTVHIPLNIPVEIKQGHLDVLKEITIPFHVMDPRSGLSRVERRHRYSIHSEDIQK